MEIEYTVTKMSIGKTDKDEREESSGITTKLSFEVQGSPRQLARTANLLKQGNVNLNLIIKATNAATDLKVESFDLPHQMGLGEKTLSPTDASKTMEESARMPPVVEGNSEPGITPIRSGEPIVPQPVPESQEAKEAFDKLESVNDPRNGNHNGHDGEKKNFLDLDKLRIKVLDDNKGYDVRLDGVRKKSPDDLVGTILYVFQQSGEKAGTPDELVDTLLLYPQSEMRDRLINVMRGTMTPETMNT